MNKKKRIKELEERVAQLEQRIEESEWRFVEHLYPWFKSDYLHSPIYANGTIVGKIRQCLTP